jgi:hypothetical protein
MAELFIANGTYRHHHFSYRVPEQRTLRKLEIPAGIQVKVPDKLEGYALEFVLQQLRTYGAVEVAEINHITHPGALIFKVSRNPISADDIDESREKDETARQNVSAEQTEKSGLALLKVVENSVGESTALSTSLEVVELQDTSGADKAAKDGVNVEIKASRGYSNEPVREKRKADKK